MVNGAPEPSLIEFFKGHLFSTITALAVILAPSAGYVLYVENRIATLEAQNQQFKEEITRLRDDVKPLLRLLPAQTGADWRTLQRQFAELHDGIKALAWATPLNPRGENDRAPPTLLLRPRPTDLRVRWGKGREFIDVTARALKLCDDLLPCNVVAGIEQLGPDPFVGLPKELVVEFRCEGEARISNQLIEREVPLLIACL